MVSLKNFLRHLIGSTASAISAPIALPVKSNPVIHASRSSVDADSPVSIHTPFFKQLILQKSTRSTASTDESPIYSPVVVNQTSGTSRAVTSAESLDLVQSHLFLQPDRFQISLGCSTDHSTAALMVIAHKVGCYTGKASLCAWNSSIPDDFSSVLVDLMPDLTLLFSVAESLTLLCDPHIWSDVQCEDVSFFLDKRHGVQELFRPCSSDDCTAAAVGTLMNGVNTVYKFLLGGYVLNRIAEKIIMQVSIQSDRTEISGLELMLKQSLSQAFLHLFNEDYGFLGCIYVTISAHFGFLTEIPYGSLPRPPDELLVISFSLLYFTLCSSCPRCNGLHLEGEY